LEECEDDESRTTIGQPFHPLTARPLGAIDGEELNVD
jgi:hypothetical protein